jgi:hypothetical protein
MNREWRTVESALNNPRLVSLCTTNLVVRASSRNLLTHVVCRRLRASRACNVIQLYHPLSRGSILTLSGLGPFQVAVLSQQGAFLLPCKELLDDLLDDFFCWVAPVVPVVCKASFLSQYRTRDGNGRTSLLLLQAMLLAAAKVSKSARLLQSLTSIRVTGSNLPLSEKTPLQTHLVDIFHEGPCTIRLPRAALGNQSSSIRC